MGNQKNIIQIFRSVDLKGSLNSLFQHPGKDIPAGIVVFLVALPLCLGIALASGAPLITGLISGIIGGIVIGSISNSSTSVSGPAASLSAVVLVMLREFETFEIFLLALVIGGVLQLILGFLKAGLIADYMPISIIKGLLAAIGIILIFSQIPYALGVELDSRLSDYSQSFFDGLPERVMQILTSISPGAVVLSIISLALLIFWDKTILKNIKLLPPSLFVVILGVGLNFFFQYFAPSFHLTGTHLVFIPEVDTLSSVLSFPDVSYILDFEVWKAGVVIAIIASVASLLNLEATDNLDPHKRRSNPNRELVAQGIGNTLAGLIGGIPITSVIVRSSVNIESGAKTKLSTLLHGFLLLASVLFLSSIINLIPLATLAAVLLVVGYKLASFSVIKNMYQKGWSQFIPFVITTIAIILTDVLLGVLIGSTFSVFFLLRTNYYNPFKLERSKSPKGEAIRLELSNEVSFLNKAALKKTLYNLPEKSKTIIDATFSSYIEPDILEMLTDFEKTYAKENKIDLSIIGLRNRYTPNSRQTLVQGQVDRGKPIDNPQEIRRYLIDGNKKYVGGNLVSRRFTNKELVDVIQDKPLAVVISCIDMREPLNMILNTGISDLILLKVPGNQISDHLIQSVEIACRVQGCKLIVVLGHSENRFIEEALNSYHRKKVSHLNHLLVPAITSGLKIQDQENTKKTADQITKWNIEEAKKRIKKENEFINKGIAMGEIGICSAFFDRKTGDVDFSLLYDTDKSKVKTEEYPIK